jgi:large subunit ribosomal protein L20
MAGLKKSGVAVNRKALADLAVHDQPAFARLTALAKDAVGVTTAA